MWASVVFMQGDEASDVLDRLLNVDAGDYHGADNESIAWAVDYLSQWDCGEESEHSLYVDVPWGSSDDTAEHDGYTLAWNWHLCYVSLNREVQ